MPRPRWRWRYLWLLTWLALPIAVAEDIYRHRRGKHAF